MTDKPRHRSLPTHNEIGWRRLRFGAIILALGLLVSGCGGSQISSGDHQKIGHALATLAVYCTTKDESGATVQQYENASAGLDTLISIFRKNPNAKDRTGQTMRQSLADIANHLHLDTCNPQFAHDVDRALAAG